MEKPEESERIDVEPQDAPVDDDENVIDISNFFNYQRAVNSLIDYLNRGIDDNIANFTRSDQLLFSHEKKKLILNSILEVGFYDFCKFRLVMIAESGAMKSQEEFMEIMEKIQGEIDLLAYLLVNTRLAHRTLTFDIFLSLLKGGLFADIIEIHEKIVKDMNSRKEQVNKNTIKSNIKMDNNALYI